MKRTLLAASSAACLMLSGAGAFAADMTVGFSQIGSESGWRAAETTVTQNQAKDLSLIHI